MRHGVDKLYYSQPHFVNWLILSFLGGSVNGGGFVACQRFVSHVTGLYTQVGVEAARFNWEAAFGLMTVPVFFLVGAMTGALLVDRRARLGLRPHYTVAMTLVFVFLLAASVGGYLNWYGVFGEPLHLKRAYLFLVLLCSACGVQNSVTTSISRGIVRTTHMSGVTTDLGIGLIRVLYPHPDSARTGLERRRNFLRAGSILSFTIGAAVGSIICLRYGYLGFLLPTALAAGGVVSAALLWDRLWDIGGNPIERSPAVTIDV